MLVYYPSIQLAISDCSSALPDCNDHFEEKFRLLNAIQDDETIIQLKEWHTYYLRFYSDPLDSSIPDLFKQDNFKQSSTFIQDKIADIYVINFQNYVGQTKIGSVKLDIINRKINQEQYQSLLSYISTRYIDLVYQFSKTHNNDKSHTGYSQKRSEVGSNLNYIDFLFLKHKLLAGDHHATIDEILNLIIKEPHYKIERECVNTPMELIKTVDPVRLIEAVTMGNNLQILSKGHALENTPLAVKLKQISAQHTAYFPITMNEEKKYHSFDTPENRFIQYFLQQLLALLIPLKKHYLVMENTYFNPDLEADLNALIHPIKNCLDDQLWREVSMMRYIPTNSQVLQRKEGYRQLLSVYSLMQLASRYDFNNFDFKCLLESKDTNILYEYWCFFMIKDILDQHLGTPIDHHSLLDESPEQTNPVLNEGTWLCYKGDIQLGFNITFESRRGSYSQEYRPDFIIKYNDQYLIFDAKHKLKGWDSDNKGQPKKEDIDKMHTYKDAINNAVGAFILYPGKEDVLYQSPDSDHEYEGVGAISLIPDHKENDQPVNNELLKNMSIQFLSIETLIS